MLASAAISQGLLTSTADSAFVEARDLLSSLLTRGRGELVLRLGSHPSRDVLFSGAPLNTPGGRRGDDLTSEQLDSAVERLRAVTEDMGAVVGFPLYQSSHQLLNLTCLCGIYFV